MARRNKRVHHGPTAPRKKTDTTDRSPKDPVVVQRAPEPAVVEAIQAIPETPAPVVEKPTPVSKDGKYGKLEFFTEGFINNLLKNPSDFLEYLKNLKARHTLKRATNLPGDDEEADRILQQLNELNRIKKDMGYN